MTTPDDKEHDKLLCERLATTVDHGICKCAERHRIAEPMRRALAAECELAEARERITAAESLLRDLWSMVRGEAPSLLDDDSGGSGHLDLAIDVHFLRYGMSTLKARLADADWRRLIKEHGDPPSCPHGVMAGPCRLCHQRKTDDEMPLL